MNLKTSFILLSIFVVGFKGYAQNIYNGGNNDGFSVSCYAQADNPILAIYNGGNNDGFSVSCYAQADNPILAIYNGGNNDGFGYSCVGGVGTEVPLPIVLLDFKAYVQDQWVNLEWQTASEINNDYFVLEKSKTGKDWVLVAKVKGAGNSSIVLNYNAVDKTPYSGISYYRLKQSDYDGHNSFSNVVAVNMQTNSNILISPNPTTGIVRIEGYNSSLGDIIILNMIGMDVTQRVHIIKASSNTIKIDLSQLSSGIYFIQIGEYISKVYKQ